MHPPPHEPHREWFRSALAAVATAACRGSRTRLARWRPGTLLPQPVVHDFNEEAFIVSRDLIVGCDDHGRGGETFEAWTFAVPSARRRTALSPRGAAA